MRERFPGQKWLLSTVATGGMMMGAGCVDTANTAKIPDRPPESTPAALVATPKSSESSAPPPTWYYAAGPHSDGGLSQNKNYAIDISPPVVKSCPGSEPLTDYPFPSPIEGKVVIVGNDKDPKDPSHSVVVVENKNGIRIGMMHLANIKVSLGQEVKSGDLIGDPSCEVTPDGGNTTGIHVHVFVTEKGSSGVIPDFGIAVPIDEIEFLQGVFKGTSREHGTLEKPGEKTRTADTRRCDTDEKCNGIRNDLTGFLQIMEPQETPQVRDDKDLKSKIIVHLLYADGNPADGSLLELYKEPEVLENDSLGSSVGFIETNKSGFATFDTQPGKYVLLFNQFKLNRIYGPKFSSSTKAPGLSGIELKPESTTLKTIKLGRVIVNLKEDPKRPVKGFNGDSDKDTGYVCIDSIVENEKPENLVCERLDDLSEENVVGASRAVINLTEGNYSLKYSWPDGTNGWRSYTAKIGETQLSWGQTLELDCFVFSPANTNSNQPSDCSVKIIK